MLGQPIGHSLSPVLHSAAYAALDLPWSYTAIDCDQARLPVLLAAAGAEWVGFSCTMPLKHAAVALADELTPTARAVGAANTLVRVARGWSASNTDVDGVVAAVRERVPDRLPNAGVLLGAGGTAQAAVVAFAELGYPAARVLVRRPDRTVALRATAERAGLGIDVRQLDAAPDASGSRLVISTLPPHAADEWAFGWRRGDVLLDVAYDPWPSGLARRAAAGAAEVVPGALMLLHQAARQVEAMTGRPAPLDAMRAALRPRVPAGAV